jgi:hypothetical protein
MDRFLRARRCFDIRRTIQTEPRPEEAVFFDSTQIFWETESVSGVSLPRLRSCWFFLVRGCKSASTPLMSRSIQ